MPLFTETATRVIGDASPLPWRQSHGGLVDANGSVITAEYGVPAEDADLIELAVNSLPLFLDLLAARESSARVCAEAQLDGATMTDAEVRADYADEEDQAMADRLVAAYWESLPWRFRGGEQ